MESRPMKRRKTEEEDGGQNVPELPPEIIEAILSRVPPKPLCRLKLVSKLWHSLISDPDFVADYNKDVFFQRRHLLFTIVEDHVGDDPPQYYSVNSLDLDKFLNQNHDGDSLVAASTELDYFYRDVYNAGDRLEWYPFVPFSCHGLFMLEVDDWNGDTDIMSIISNPFTQQSKTIPNPPIWEPLKEYNGRLRGLGFDYSTSEHKVISGTEYEDYGIVFSVYTLQTDAWRRIEHLYPYESRAPDGIVVNGALHWRVKKLADGEWVIIRFLLAEEKVEEIELPPDGSGLKLGAFRNSLCLTSFSTSETHDEFLVLKEEYGVREYSWTKMKISKPYKDLSHSGFWTDTHDLMVIDTSSLVLCNFRDGTSWNLPIGDLGKDCSFGSVHVYVECLPSKVETSVSRRGLWQGKMVQDYQPMNRVSRFFYQYVCDCPDCVS